LLFIFVSRDFGEKDYKKYKVMAAVGLLVPMLLLLAGAGTAAPASMLLLSCAQTYNDEWTALLTAQAAYHNHTLDIVLTDGRLRLPSFFLFFCIWPCQYD
jgi:hypothetical protein